MQEQSKEEQEQTLLILQNYQQLNMALLTHPVLLRLLKDAESIEAAIKE